MEENQNQFQLNQNQPLTTPQSQNDNKVLGIVVGVVVLLLIGGLFVYLRNQKPTSTATSRVVIQELNNLGSELQSLDDGTNEADLNALDKDIQSL